MIRRSRADLVSKTRNDPAAGKQPKEWMTSGEVARALSMTDAAIRRWAREGLIEVIKTPGGQYRFSRQALARLLQVKHHHNGSAPKSPKRKRTRS